MIKAAYSVEFGAIHAQLITQPVLSLCKLINCGILLTQVARNEGEKGGVIVRPHPYNEGFQIYL